MEKLNLLIDINGKWERVSTAGKEYIETELKNVILFYKGYLSDSYTISSIKHFKAFKEIWNKEISEDKINKAA